jgi:nitrogen regulatory protein PII
VPVDRLFDLLEPHKSLAAVKQVVAIIKPFLAEKVLEGLKRAPLEALSVREVKGYGRQKNYLDEYGQTEYAMAFLPKVEITMWVDDARVGEIVRKVVAVARTGRMGDGKIFVVPAASPERVIDIAAGKPEPARGKERK